MISFTFDDFPISALEVAGPILAKYSAPATYYAALGLMGRKESPVGPIFSEADLKEVVKRGHELGCHTYSHCDAWFTGPAEFEASVLRNEEALKKIMPEAAFASLSYPICVPRPETKRRSARRFSCCRGGGQTFNTGVVDLSNLKAYFLEQSKGDLNPVRRLIDQNAAQNGWLIFATHDVCEKPTRLGCTPEFFETVVSWSVQSGAKILPVGRARELVRTA